MRYAIFSDIHSHSAALEALIRDAASRNIDAYYCLGDVGGDESVALVRNLSQQTLFGNWEVSNWRHLSPQNQKWALNLAPTAHFPEQGFCLSHAAPNWPENIHSLDDFLQKRHQLGMQSVFPYYLSESPPLMNAFATLMTQKLPILFHGHTHQQRVWVFDTNNSVHHYGPAAFSLEDENVYMVGVGSVGQPRDTHRPSYVIFDSDKKQVSFIRV